MTTQEKIDKIIKVNDDFKLGLKKLPSKFKIENFEKYEFPTESTLRNPTSVLRSNFLMKNFFTMKKFQNAGEICTINFLSLPLK
jgi:hypothetical protein